MKLRWTGWALAWILASPVAAAPPTGLACRGKEGWSDPAPPVRIVSYVYDVGTCGIVVLLVVGYRGAILIDGATAEAVPSIVANVERLGLRAADVKLILASHEHADHAGGLASLQRRTSATMVATAAAKCALETGVPDATDPQRDGDRPSFAGVRVGRVVRDGEVVTLGDLRPEQETLAAMLAGETRDETWNACQRQFLVDGWMHKNLRMYWCKRPIAWTPTPESAWATACFSTIVSA